MKKILFLIPMLLIITGCSVTDNITITKDLTVEEKINMAESSEFFASRYKELPITVIKSILDTGNRKNTLIENGYSYIQCFTAFAIEYNYSKLIHLFTHSLID